MKSGKEGQVTQMKIQAVKIDGYKNLKSISFSLSKITALIALNNFGKSNVLDAINFGTRFIRANEDRKTEMMSSGLVIPINKENASHDFKFEMELLTIEGEKTYRLLYGYQFEWAKKDDEGCQIVKEYLKIKLDEKGQRYGMLISRDKKGVFYKNTETGRCTTGIVIEDNELVVNKLKAFDSLYFSEIIKKINGIRLYLEDNFDVKHLYSADPLIRKGMERITVDEDNLPRIIYSIKKNYTNYFERLLDAYKSLFPQIEDVIVRELKIDKQYELEIPDDIPFIVSDNVYLLFVKDSNLNQPINFQLMSDGAKRVFMILTRIIVANIENVALIAIEEPENSVHPNLLQDYLQILNSFLENCKIIITSHSPYIVNYLNPLDICIGMSRENGIAEFYSIRKTAIKKLENDASSVDQSLGDYIFTLLSNDSEELVQYLEGDVYE